MMLRFVLSTLLALLVSVSAVSAQEMTDAHKVQLRTAILADPGAAQFYTDGDNTGLADYMNANAAPAYIVWKTRVLQDEVMLNGFDWARVDNLSAGKARIWEWLFDNAQNAIDPSKPNIRAGIDATWVGTQADLAVRAAVYVHCKRPASRFERVFATGTGSDAVPGTMGVEGPVTTFVLQQLPSLP